MPKPPKVKGADYADFNRACIDDLESKVADGTVSIRDYAKLKQSVELYKLHTDLVTNNDELNHYWIYGPTGTGKSLGAREYAKTKYDGEYYNKPCNKWWDGYQG